MFNLIWILFIGRATGRYAPGQHSGYLMSILGASAAGSVPVRHTPAHGLNRLLSAAYCRLWAHPSTAAVCASMRRIARSALGPSQINRRTNSRTTTRIATG
jgi:hypothetical protein